MNLINKRLKTILLLIIIISNFTSFSQIPDTIKLSLKDAIQLAQKNSSEALRAKNLYLIKYWNYRTYKADLLPNVNFNLTPVTYNRSLIKRYDYEQNIDIFREQQAFESYAGLSISQNIGFTGGNLFVKSDLSRLMNYGNPSVLNYNASWFNIGYSQPVMGYNSFKWKKKTEPVKFEVAKKEYVQNLVKVNIKTTKLFFSLLIQYQNYYSAQSNLKNTLKLYEIGRQKYNLMAIKKEDLLNLELNKYNAETEVKKQKQLLEQSNFRLKNFLNLDSNIVISPKIPNVPDTLRINITDALQKVQKNNPDILRAKQNLLEAEAKLDKQIKESRFNADLLASIGINQKDQDLSNAYKNPTDQEFVMFTLKIPLIDWGKAKGKIKMAKMNREIVNIDAKQQNLRTIETIKQTVTNFNLQSEIVNNSTIAMKIAEESYNLTQKSFINGQTDVQHLNLSYKQFLQAQIDYLNNLYLYWKFFYEVQKLTLFDYMYKTKIKFNEESVKQ